MSEPIRNIGAELDAFSLRLNVLTWLHVGAAALAILLFIPGIEMFHVLPRPSRTGRAMLYLAAALVVSWPYIFSWVLSRQSLAQEPHGFVRYVVGFVAVSTAGLLFFAFAPTEVRTVWVLIAVTLVQFVALKGLAVYLESVGSTDRTAV